MLTRVHGNYLVIYNLFGYANFLNCLEKLCLHFPIEHGNIMSETTLFNDFSFLLLVKLFDDFNFVMYICMRACFKWRKSILRKMY